MVIQKVQIQVYPVINTDPFRAFPRGQGQTRSAGNGPVLSKDRNAVMASWDRSQRASQEAAIHCVMPLGKRTTLPGEAGLVSDRFLTR